MNRNVFGTDRSSSKPDGLAAYSPSEDLVRGLIRNLSGIFVGSSELSDSNRIDATIDYAGPSDEIKRRILHLSAGNESGQVHSVPILILDAQSRTWKYHELSIVEDTDEFTNIVSLDAIRGEWLGGGEIFDVYSLPNSPWAVRISMHGTFCTDHGDVDKILRNFSTLAKLSIAPKCLGHGMIAGADYFLVEEVKGTSLKNLLRHQMLTKDDWDLVLDLFDKIVANGVIIADPTPENFVIGSINDGRRQAYLVDPDQAEADYFCPEEITDFLARTLLDFVDWDRELLRTSLIPHLLRKRA